MKDNIGYCWDPSSMKILINYLESQEILKVRDGFIGGILPHDDYSYAGRVYYPLVNAIRNIKEVIIFGVTHFTGRKINDPRNVLIFDNHLY